MSSQVNYIPGLVLKEHTFEVPLDYSQPKGEKIKVFGREVVAKEMENNNDLPWLVYFQGGPGFGSPRPLSNSGWLKRALKEFRVFLLDQRGTTNRGFKVHSQTLSHLSPEDQAEFLMHFRTDNIIRDAEFIRKKLVKDKWSLLGQSFGGFCILTYLSQSPEGVKEAFITGGVPSIERHVDDVYRETYELTKLKNKIYYDRYPQDKKTVKQIVDYLHKNEVTLPCGDRLSARRFLCMGINFGFQSGYETVHYLVENAFVETAAGSELSYEFLKGMEQHLSFDTNPIYAILHEAIYAQGFSTRWSAERIKEEHEEFSHDKAPVLFTGEMVYSWFFDEFKQLQPLKKAAEILA
ncbi:MAG: alpha/beta hydrolase, partial [Lentisphaeraceae bacterium]|nr:alpha/beta hydrolase [Lentisphaeraceae bacterium]